MYEVATRELPARSLLCLKHHVDGSAGEWALGKEFVAIFRERPVPQMQGIIGAAFVIYHGEVNEDSDGPIEWCRPVPDDQAEALAASYPELTLRTEPAQAFIHLGNAQATPPRWQLVSETLHDWAAEHHPEPANLNLGVRMTFLDTPPHNRRERAHLRLRGPTGLTPGRAKTYTTTAPTSLQLPQTPESVT